MSLPSSSQAISRPWLLYSYPWMPFPRRLQLYLREKRIPSSLVQVVHVSDPQPGDCVVPGQADKYPPRPQGSLPILAIPPSSSILDKEGVKAREGEGNEWTSIGQSMAIIAFLEEVTAEPGSIFIGQDGNAADQIRPLYQGSTTLERVQLLQIQTLAEELTVSWNPIRTFGSGAGTIKFPEGAKEMYRWVTRTLDTVDRYLAAANDQRKLTDLSDDERPVSLADILLYQFLEFVDYCYGIDVTLPNPGRKESGGAGQGAVVMDVYGREEAKGEFPNLRAFYVAFGKRKSARRDEARGEVAAPAVLERMSTWWDGVW